MFPKKLNHKLDHREQNNALRKLGYANHLTDFSSNDYLGFSSSNTIYDATLTYLKKEDIESNGATGSRLLSGNHKLYSALETLLCEIHNSEASLVFNSGYNANIGFFSCVPQRNDIILYDELVHASIRDGIAMSNAKSFKFKHNDLDDFQDLLKRIKIESSHIYVVTESVFSMDGDTPDLIRLSELCKDHNLYLIIDEAHAIGVFGTKGQGLVQDLGIEHLVFARIITFGKALGCHGAAILASKLLISYLINFSRPFIYTTALSPHTIATIICAYNTLLERQCSEILALSHNISFFKTELKRLGIYSDFILSNSAIQCSIIPGNTNVKSIASTLVERGFDVKPILSPTVAKGEERLRFCVHSFNSENEITSVLELFSTLIKA